MKTQKAVAQKKIPTLSATLWRTLCLCVILTLLWSSPGVVGRVRNLTVIYSIRRVRILAVGVIRWKSHPSGIIGCTDQIWLTSIHLTLYKEDICYTHSTDTYTGTIRSTQTCCERELKLLRRLCDECTLCADCSL